MPRSSQFSIRSLLALTTLVCLLFLPLLCPSYWWALGFAPVASWICVFGVSRLVVAPERQGVFWATFLAGCIAYLAAVNFVRTSGTMYDLQRRDMWMNMIAVPAWKMIHGESAFITNPRGLTSEDHLSFQISLHIVAAVLFTLPVSITAQYAANWRVGKDEAGRRE
jgi:hypothetical protein